VGELFGKLQLKPGGAPLTSPVFTCVCHLGWYQAGIPTWRYVLTAPPFNTRYRNFHVVR
jgi:hypothetical protein